MGGGSGAKLGELGLGEAVEEEVGDDEVVAAVGGWGEAEGVGGKGLEAGGGGGVGGVSAPGEQVEHGGGDVYGVGVEPTNDYGRRCLLARKLVEDGVRFVCVVSGGGPGNMQWDAHNDIEENHRREAAEILISSLSIFTDEDRIEDLRAGPSPIGLENGGPGGGHGDAAAVF